MALVDLFENISFSLEKNEHTIGIFTDLAKAFDTVNLYTLEKTIIIMMFVASHMNGSKAI